ncbi:MAG: HTTM domain-containing protein [Acidimicrobiia bacterium]|nr:HTTM domain-containing protein [Acidimicrobiia bacterium]
MSTVKTGHVEYLVKDPSTGNAWLAGPELVPTGWQAAGPNVRPDLIQAIALLMANPGREEGQQDLEVRADVGFR